MSSPTQVEVTSAGEQNTGVQYRADIESQAVHLASILSDVSTNIHSPALAHSLPSISRTIKEATNRFKSGSEKELRVSYAAEWLLDNDYIAYQAIRQVEVSLPVDFNRELPVLTSTRLAGYPRVYSLASEIIKFSRMNIDLEGIESFTSAFQTITALTMGELWALPVVLRLVVLQALATSAAHLTGIEAAPAHINLPPLELPDDLTGDEIVSGGITSLRMLATQDWKKFFERLSQVNEALAHDPSGIYLRMDFETRDSYRKAVEKIASRSKEDQLRVAETAVQMALLANREAEPDSIRQGHVGYYLVAEGRQALETRVGFQPGLKVKTSRWLAAHPNLVYQGSIVLLSLLFLAWVTIIPLRSDTPLWRVVIGLLLGLTPSTAIAVALVNWLITRLIPPRVLPKMDYSEGLPKSIEALVVVPAIIDSPEDIQPLVSQLELHYLRNTDPNLSFLLLSDFSDAPQEHMPGEDARLDELKKGIMNLNRRYPRSTGDRFILIHRQRTWNPSEGVWMGWERKRGKLHELNRMILDAHRHHLPVRPAGDSIGETPAEVLRRACCVITLDEDTILPPGSAQKLVATLTHPLNRAEFDANGRVTAGYTILQPRTRISPVSALRTPFTRIYSGNTGLDLYTLAVSDVYQDLFGEGIYTGKGIYDVETFERSLMDRVPENTLLSHDLFEGLQGRAGLVSDIVLIEEYPSAYLGHIRRLGRWIRGDWQLLPWLTGRDFPKDPDQAGRLSIIDRWKIFDNLRRSLVPPLLLVLLAAAWLGLLPGSIGMWTALALLGFSVPFFTGLIDQAFHSIRGVVAYTGENLPRIVLAVIFLPFESLISLDAIFRTLWRLVISHKHLLAWLSSAGVEKSFLQDVDHAKIFRRMYGGCLIALLITAGILLIHPQAFLMALPFLVTWLISPEIAYRISLRVHFGPAPLTETDIEKLRLLARSTWLFFEQFVGPEDHWLPPDHYQESPLGTVAHRTSPTNIGMSLVATLVAYDFGYIGLLALAARFRSSMDTIMQLQKHRGHLLNWYDTRTLETLQPRYVSTVDSGNLAASLITLRQGLLEMPGKKVFRWETLQGILDTIALISKLLENIDQGDAQKNSLKLRQYLEHWQLRIRDVQARENDWVSMLFLMKSGRGDEPTLMVGIDRLMLELIENSGLILGQDVLSQLRQYSVELRARLDTAVREIEVLTPWVTSIAEARPFSQGEGELSHLWSSLVDHLSQPSALGQLDEYGHQVRQEVAILLEKVRSTDGKSPAPQTTLLEKIDRQLDSGMSAAKILLIGFQELASDAKVLNSEMDFRFLYDPERQVFHIGYNLSLNRLDPNYYDLLASEARIASLIAIAWRDVPASHWLHLARPVTYVGGMPVLLSWSATMFEYLMPTLFLRRFEETLLATSQEGAIDSQIKYAREKGLPWGISESGYYRFDPAMAYQYKAFGVPELGYKRGLSDDLVIAPYASMLAVRSHAEAVLSNIDALSRVGALGLYGLYEAIDYTPERMPLGAKYEIVREYMSHHQGMIFLALANALLDDIVVKRFHSDLYIQSVELLLQEQVPEKAEFENPHTDELDRSRFQQPQVSMTPWRARVNASHPRVHYLSNGRFSSLITAAGGGFSTWKGTDLTRWRSDTTLGDWGTWTYIQDLDANKLWSVGLLPTGVNPASRDVYFNAHMVTYLRRDGDIGSGMDIAISPDDDVEVRLLTLTNHGNRRCHLRVVSYGEVVLALQSADRRHPAFNKLFIESEYVPEENALLYKRRPRSSQEDVFYLGHALITGTDQKVSGLYESDRMAFLGRLGSTRMPGKLMKPVWEKGTQGATLDPIYSLCQEVILEPNSTSKLAFLTLTTQTRSDALALVQRYTSWAEIERTFSRARAQAEVELSQLGLDTVQLPRIQHLLSGLLFPHYYLRPPDDVLIKNQKGQSSLWAYGISGDYPILLVKLNGPDEIALAQELVQAHTYWRARGLMIDLVFLNEQGADYGQELSNALFRMMQRSGSDAWLNRRGGIYMLLSDRLATGDQVLLETAARVVLDGKRGSLADNLPRMDALPSRLPAFSPSLENSEPFESTPMLEKPADLKFDNGYGGFSPDGKEYVIYLEPNKPTPAPWVNVIGYPEFGFIAHESGLGSTWSINSGENRLTPWRNDPVSDQPSEMVYLRDEETGVVWTPTPLPAGDGLAYLVHHGAGYTIYEHNSRGLKQQLRVFASTNDPVKIISLRLENTWNRARRVTATYYAEWVLGLTHEESQQFILPSFEGDTQALLARNPYHAEFSDRVAFAAASRKLHGLTADRTEFFGRMGDPRLPAALKRIGLAGTVQPGLDPCAALQLHMDLQPGESQEVYFLLGEAQDRESALDLVKEYQSSAKVAGSWQQVHQFWDKTLGQVQVRTPDPVIDLMMNRWLLYEALSCRFWGRSAFYQPSGAYGYRDQLQDVMAFLYSRPDLAREHILRAAAHQFELGDVLHWWHPPSGRGIRSRFSDDLLWLPFVTARYIEVTGDTGILEEEIPYVYGSILDPGENERYGQYASTTQSYTLFEHCRQAVERGSTTGAHGLPLIGSGDWNDGMNRVGDKGQGESIWLAWFLIDVLNRFAELCDRHGNPNEAKSYRSRADEYRKAVEAQAWDGQWYLRAFYDDGTPLGSSSSRECKIDSIAQSWAVLSGAGDPERSLTAMTSVLERLYKPDQKLLLLFSPPFDKTSKDPGYIKGYLPGIRENGGQYTHGAIWTAWAFARLHDGEKAGNMFDMLNPIRHTLDEASVQKYKVEPYVIAADVYGAAPYTGRGGWTWYTGSAAWMYRLGLEAIIGLRKKGDCLEFDPCLRAEWKELQLSYQYNSAEYKIQLLNPEGLSHGKMSIELDGKSVDGGQIELKDDGSQHIVTVRMDKHDSS